jgi:hypothetical protein
MKWACILLQRWARDSNDGRGDFDDGENGYNFSRKLTAISFGEITHETDPDDGQDCLQPV